MVTFSTAKKIDMYVLAEIMEAFRVHGRLDSEALTDIVLKMGEDEPIERKKDKKGKRKKSKLDSFVEDSRYYGCDGVDIVGLSRHIVKWYNYRVSASFWMPDALRGAAFKSVASYSELLEQPPSNNSLFDPCDVESFEDILVNTLSYPYWLDELKSLRYDILDACGADIFIVMVFLIENKITVTQLNDKLNTLPSELKKRFLEIMSELRGSNFVTMIASELGIALEIGTSNSVFQLSLEYPDSRIHMQKLYGDLYPIVILSKKRNKEFWKKYKQGKKKLVEDYWVDLEIVTFSDGVMFAATFYESEKFKHALDLILSQASKHGIKASDTELYCGYGNCDELMLYGMGK